MTPEEFILKQQKILEKIGNGDILSKATFEVHRQMTNRIFISGMAQNGSIGRYNSTKPIYVNPKTAPRVFQPKGKYGATIHKNKKPYKTGYFNSYADFRGKMGRKTDGVNLNLTGLLQNDFATGVKKVNNNRFISILKRRDSQLKAAGAEKHFGKKIFVLTKKERALFVKLINDQIINAQ